MVQGVNKNKCMQLLTYTKACGSAGNRWEFDEMKFLRVAGNPPPFGVYIDGCISESGLSEWINPPPPR